MNKIICEIINPSDKYYISSFSWEALCVACHILGSGYYGLEEINVDDNRQKKVMPLFIFGGVDDWFKGTFLKNFDETYIETDKLTLIEALESVCIASEEYFMALKYIPKEKHLLFTREFNEKKRTSTNNISGTAISYAEKLRRKYDLL